MVQLRKRCDHEYPTKVMTLKTVDIYAGEFDSALKFAQHDDVLVLNLTSTSHKPTLPDDLKWLSEIYFEEIVLCSPDGEVPRVKPIFWTALIDYAADKNKQAILIHCKAGHGRTGFALAAMRIAYLKETPSEAVKQIRRLYCSESIETQSQVDGLGGIAESFEILNDADMIDASFHNSPYFSMSQF